MSSGDWQLVWIVLGALALGSAMLFGGSELVSCGIGHLER